jgi:hypothetical protein
MPKYETKYCEGFWLPDDPSASHVDFMHVTVALGSWDEVEDEEDREIFFYMDGEPLERGLIISDGFVITNIEGEDNG